MEERKRVVNIEFDSNKIYLYRFMSIEQFVDMLLNKQNTLVQPSLWEDPDEGILSSFSQNTKSPLFRSIGQCYGQCWTRNEECEAFWRRYCHKQSGRCVKIKVSRDNLRKTLESYDADGVEYVLGDINYAPLSDKKETVELAKVVSSKISQDEILSYNSVIGTVEFGLMLLKREAYKYEEETRILTFHEKEVPDRKVWKYPFDVNSSVEEIMLDPWTPDYCIENYKLMFEKLGVKDVDNKVTKSSLLTSLTKL